MYTPFLDPIDAAAPQLLATLRRWAEVNSGTYNLVGLEAMRAALREAFAPLGSDVSEVHLPPATSINARGDEVQTPLGKALVIHKRADAPLRVLLVIHYDTVFPADGAFRHTEMTDADTLRGPGVVDAKGGIVVMLAALRALESSPWRDRIGWEVILNPDEEIGSVGSASLLKEAAARNHLGLVFEPAFPDGAMVDARKGSGTVTAVVRGRAAHAGRDFSGGRSAINALAELIVAVEQPPVPGAIVNCGRIEGGGATNIVPDLAIGRFNLRADTAEQRAAVEQMFRHATEHVRQRRDGISIELHGNFNFPPKPLDARSRKLLDAAIACGRELGITITTRPSGGASDGNKLAAAGMPVVDSLGPVGGELHSEREFVRVGSIAERAKLTTLLLMKLASGEIPPP